MFAMFDVRAAELTSRWLLPAFLLGPQDRILLQVQIKQTPLQNSKPAPTSTSYIPFWDTPNQQAVSAVWQIPGGETPFRRPAGKRESEAAILPTPGAFRTAQAILAPNAGDVGTDNPVQMQDG